MFHGVLDLASGEVGRMPKPGHLLSDHLEPTTISAFFK